MTDQNKTTIVSRPNPYVGPRAFRKNEKLFGRDRESSELFNLLIAERIVLLHSPSGAGKSSLLYASIIPTMEANNFAALPVMRVNYEEEAIEIRQAAGFNRYVYSAIQSVEDAFPKTHRLDPASLAGMKLKDYVATYRERAVHIHPDFDRNHSLLLVLDQMEEVVTLNPVDRAAKQEFFVQLGQTLADRDIWCLVAIREDYLALLDPYVRPVPTRFTNRYRLNLLETDAALDAVRKPAEEAGVTFEEDAARAVIQNLSKIRVQEVGGKFVEQDGQFIEPVHLQVVCRRLWETLPSGITSITTERVAQSGDVNSALSEYYDLQVSAVSAKSGVRERAIREWFDRKLITINGIRVPVLLEEGKSGDLPNSAIELLEKAYLVREEKRGGASWFELAHDRLIAPVRENNAAWFVKHLSNLQRQADLWNTQKRPDGMLFTGHDYLEAAEWAKKHDDILRDFERDFLEQCRQAHEAIIKERNTHRLVRRLLIAASISFVITFIASIVAYNFYLRALDAEKRAFSRELAASAINSLDDDPERSVLLSLASLGQTDDALAESVQALHQSLAKMRIVQVMRGHQGKVYAVSYNPNGKQVASAGSDGTLRLWNLASGENQVLLEVAEGEYVTNVAFNKEGGVLAASDSLGVVHIWNANTLEPITRLQVSDSIIWGLSLSPDGRFVATGAEDYTTSIVEIASARVTVLGIPYCRSTVRDTCAYGHTDVVETVTFSPDGRLLATGGDDTEIKIWDAATGEYLYHLNGPDAHEGIIYGLAFSPDGTRLASGSSDRTLKIWDLSTKTPMTISGHVDWVYDLVFTPDGKSVLSTSSDRSMRMWDATYGRAQLEFDGHTGQVFDVAVSPDGRYAVTASEDNTLRMWDISPAGTRELVTMDNMDIVYAVEFSPDGSLLATAGRNNVVKIWDEKTGEMLKFFTGEHRRVIEALAWDPTGARIVSAARDGKAIVWDVSTGAVLQTFENHKAPLFAVSFVPGENLVATGGGDSMVRFWDPDTGEEKIVLDAGLDGNSISALAFSADGSYLAVAYFFDPYLILVWDWRTQTVLYTLEGHTDYAQGVAFNPIDPNSLASVSDDGRLILWDLTNQANSQVFKDHIGTVYDVDFTPDGQQVITVGVDSVVKVRDLATGWLLNLYGHTARTLTVAVSPDGRHVASGGNDYTIRLYTLDIDELVDAARQRLTRQLSEDECARNYLEGSPFCDQSGLNTQEDAKRDPVLIMPGTPDIQAIPTNPRGDAPNDPLVVAMAPTALAPVTGGDAMVSTATAFAFATSLPVATPTLSPTPAPPMLRVDLDSFCRGGPGASYDVVTGVKAGARLPILGKSTPEGWWYVNVAGVSCWIYARQGTTEGDTSKVPVLTAPPTPLPSATPTFPPG